MASLQELLQQQQAISAQIEEARRSEMAEVLAGIRSQVQQYGLTVGDVFPGGAHRRGKTLGKVTPKYRDPATGATWTGRGKPPKWIEGKDRSSFLI
jgi:DNA-binding protein H-NS